MGVWRGEEEEAAAWASWWRRWRRRNRHSDPKHSSNQTNHRLTAGRRSSSSPLYSSTHGLTRRPRRRMLMCVGLGWSGGRAEGGRGGRKWAAAGTKTQAGVFRRMAALLPDIGKGLGFGKKRIAAPPCCLRLPVQPAHGHFFTIQTVCKHCAAARRHRELNYRTINAAWIHGGRNVRRGKQRKRQKYWEKKTFLEKSTLSPLFITAWQKKKKKLSHKWFTRCWTVRVFKCVDTWHTSRVWVPLCDITMGRCHFLAEYRWVLFAYCWQSEFGGWDL